MARLHLFYPENDLALALNDVNYTAPRAAVDLRISGEPIAMWLGNDGDKFVTQGVNAKWYDAIVEAFDVRVDLFDGDTTSLQPQPWGWSLPVRKMFLDLGFDECVLPPVEQIERIRLLSHRRTSMGLAQQLFGDFGAVMGSPAVEVDRAENILDYVHSHGRAMIKLPWSSSGRGVVDTFNLSDDEIVRRAMGTVRKQGTVMLEPFYDNPRNFAYLYEMRNGEARFSGYSLFDVDSHCAYSGSVVANDAILESKIAEFVDIELLRAVRDELQTQLTNVVGDAYDGYLGVDMMAANGILAVAEMNLRTTMGHVAHRLAERFVADGAVGRFAIVPRTDNSIFMPTDCTIQNNGLTAGTLDLVPADRRNRFLLKIG